MSDIHIIDWNTSTKNKELEFDFELNKIHQKTFETNDLSQLVKKLIKNYKKI